MRRWKMSDLMSCLVLHIDPGQVVVIDRQPRLAGLGEARVAGPVPLHGGPLRVSGAVDVLMKHVRSHCCH